MTDTDKVEIRVVLPGRYPPGCTNPDYMWGHYFYGVSTDDAISKAKQSFGSEVFVYVVSRVRVAGEWRTTGNRSYHHPVGV